MTTKLVDGVEVTEGRALAREVAREHLRAALVAIHGARGEPLVSATTRAELEHAFEVLGGGAEPAGLKRTMVWWSMDSDHADPVKAAREALDAQRAPDSTATVFDVATNGRVVRVDFDPEA